MEVPDRLLSLRRAVEYGKAEGKRNLIVNLELLDLLLRGELPVGGNELPPEDVTRLLYEVKAERDQLRRFGEDTRRELGEFQVAANAMSEITRLRRGLSAEREKRRAAEGREAELRAALGEAAEQVHQWGCYAAEYHQSKWDLKSNIERLRKLAAAGPGEAGKETT